MDTKRYKKMLLDKERELEAGAGDLEAQVRAAPEDIRGDEADQAISSEERDLAVQQHEVVQETLTQVRDALKRIEDGTFGTCVNCGRPIEKARLDAIPWTPYCLEDQEAEANSDSRPST